MKILLTADPPIPVPPSGYGGIERIVDALVRSYRSSGHTVGLVAHPRSNCDTDVLFGWPKTAAGDFRTTVENSFALAAAVRSFKPDVLHSFSRLGYMLPLLPRVLPKVMSYQRHTGGRQISWASRIAGASLEFTGCSEFICNMGRPSGGKWSAIPNFVELEKIKYVERVPEDAPLLFLSRVESIKGPDLAIAIARASNRRLVLAGNRPERGSELEFWERKIAPEIGKNGVEWVGEVGDVRKNELLGAACALLVPIQWDEPFGIVFAEALAAGTPVITCARGAAPEIIMHGRTGFFVSDVNDGTAAVSKLGQIERSACHLVAKDQFSRDICAARYLQLYHTMEKCRPAK